MAKRKYCNTVLDEHKANFTLRSTTDYQFMASDFRVIPELDRKDADVSLKLVTKNSLKYLRPVDDPLFSAHRAQNVTMQGGGMIQYLSDFPGSIIGCVQQVSWFACALKMASANHKQSINIALVNSSAQNWQVSRKMYHAYSQVQVRARWPCSNFSGTQQ
jgi:hypothetical protein